MKGITRGSYLKDALAAVSASERWSHKIGQFRNTVAVLRPARKGTSY